MVRAGVLIGIVLWSLLGSSLLAASVIQLAVYKDVEGLDKEIAQITSSDYRQLTRIEKSGELYYASAILPSDREALEALPVYQKVFPDAFILSHSIPTVKKREKQEQSVAPHLHGESPTIRLAVYKNAESLQSQVAKVIPEKYRKKIRIETSGELHYASATLLAEEDVDNALKAYRAVFPDAFLMPAKMGIASEEQTTIYDTPRSAKDEKKQLGMLRRYLEKTKDERVTYNPADLSQLLNSTPVRHWERYIHDNHSILYLCHEDGAQRELKIVTKLAFENGGITYTSLTHNKPPMRIGYRYSGDKLAIIDINKGTMLLEHKIISVNKDYIKAGVWQHGLYINTARYYFNKEKSLAFIRKGKENSADE